MSYQADLKTHLIEYKLQHLGISEPGVFRYRGRDVLLDHILPIEEFRANLLDEAEPRASAFLAANPGKRHRYFHHLNSSQAFAFNLFFPYFSAEPPFSPSALLRALGENGELAHWEPECVPIAEEGTNVDVSWTTADGVQTFCEVKLSEADFGKAANDDRHAAKLAEIYRPILKEHLYSARLERSAFCNAYQFNRNVWHLVRADNSRLIFLLPRANSGLWAQLQELLVGVVDPTRERISAVAMEDVLIGLSTDELCHPRLRIYARKLIQKYIIPRRG